MAQDNLLIGDVKSLDDEFVEGIESGNNNVINEELKQYITANSTYKDLEISYCFMDNILGGTKQARRMLETDTKAYFGEQEYKFRRPNETEADFKYRLSKLTMTQFVGNTIEHATGILNKKPTTISFESENPDEIVSDFFKDVDGNNTSIQDLTTTIFSELMTYGKVGLLTDITSPESLIGKDTITIKEAKEAGQRSVIRVLQAKDIINWKYQDVDGIERLMWITVREKPSVNNDETIYRVFIRGGKWYKITKNNDGYHVESGQSNLFTGEIPLEMIYAKKPKRPQDIEPLLMDMCYHQVDEMELFTDLKIGGSYSCYTSFFVGGANKEDFAGDTAFGPNKLIICSAESSSMSQIATNSAGLKSAEEILEVVMSRIVKSSIEIMSSTSSNITARQVNVDREENLSKLVYMATSTQYGLNNTRDRLYHINNWDEKNKASLQVNDDISNKVIDPQMVAQLKAMWLDRGLSLETFQQILKDGEILPSEFDALIEKERIKSEMKDSIEMGED